jgi:hypothetical protein
MPTKKNRLDGIKETPVSLAAALGQKSPTASNTAFPVKSLNEALKNPGRSTNSFKVSVTENSKTEICIPTVKAMTDKVKKQASGQKRMKNGL